MDGKRVFRAIWHAEKFLRELGIWKRGKAGAGIMNKKSVFLLLLVLIAFFLSGCVPGHGAYTEEHPAGFFSGIWHGWIAPILLIWRLFFDDTVRIYEPINVGWWYEFGFYIAIVGGFGGFALSRRKR